MKSLVGISEANVIKDVICLKNKFGLAINTAVEKFELSQFKATDTLSARFAWPLVKSST